MRNGRSQSEDSPRRPFGPLFGDNPGWIGAWVDGVESVPKRPNPFESKVAARSDGDLSLLTGADETRKSER